MRHIGDIILDLARCYKSVKVTDIDMGWLIALDGTALGASGGGRGAANVNHTKAAILTEEEVLEARRRINDDVFDF